MKSIVAQMDYAHQIQTWQSRGVPFNIYVYVPEVHPDTNTTFYEQEDVVHLLKVNNRAISTIGLKIIDLLMLTVLTYVHHTFHCIRVCLHTPSHTFTCVIALNT